MRKHYEYEGEPVYTSRRSKTLANRKEGNRGYQTLRHNRRLREEVVFSERDGWMNELAFFREYEQDATVGKIPPPIRGRIGFVYRNNIGIVIIHRGNSYLGGYFQKDAKTREKVSYFPTKGWLTDRESYEFLSELAKSNPKRHRTLLERMGRVAKALRGGY